METNDPFVILGLPARFDLREADVRAAWLRRSAALHPDRADANAGMDEAERARAAAVLNDAKRTLEDPERRADALLLRLGGATKEQDKSIPPEVLMEMMEARETLEQAASAGDAAALDGSRAWAEERRAGHIERVGDLFARAGDPPDAAALRAVRAELNAWRYVERMLEQIDAPPASG
ncbi:MAG: Fe-S protein assembly co-chaperone HscB [Phycisphaerales bacterium]|nr:MAG: Fe-S protein assembly co-chaperone HscB [Phycisphaerales bacterium]